MAGLVAGQLAEDGIYPDAGAAFEAAETDGAPQPVRDYSPDQPRDPQGRWTEGGGGGSAGQSESATAESGTAETPRSLTIHPRVSGTDPSVGPAATPEPNTTGGILGEIGNALAFLTPITPAHAEEAGSPQVRANTGSTRAGPSGNAPELSSENTPHAPDGTPIELASSRKSRARAIATLLTGATKLAQKLWEYFESDEPDPLPPMQEEPSDQPPEPTKEIPGSAASGDPYEGQNVPFDRSNLEDKIKNYLLRPEHGDNKGKANFFQSNLGLKPEDWKHIADQINFDKTRVIFEPKRTDKYGNHYYSEVIKIYGSGGRSVDVKAAFAVQNGRARLVTLKPY